MEIFTDEAWRDVPLRGSWFTEAFEGPMSNLQRVIAGEDPALVELRWTTRSRRWRSSRRATSRASTARSPISSIGAYVREP